METESRRAGSARPRTMSAPSCLPPRAWFCCHWRKGWQRATLDASTLLLASLASMLSAQQQANRDMARDFARREITPFAARSRRSSVRLGDMERRRRQAEAPAQEGQHVLGAALG